VPDLNIPQDPDQINIFEAINGMRRFRRMRRFRDEFGTRYDELPTGAAVASFTVASTPRSFDKASGEWKDGEALFLRCNIWRQAAENVAESLVRGARVIVQGRLKQRSFETREGEKRTVVELDVDEIGASLKYATAKVNKVARGGGSGGYGSTSTSSKPPEDDPWGSAPPVGAGNYADEPPF
jgi:single-strand DNA-binding protein